MFPQSIVTLFHILAPPTVVPFSFGSDPIQSEQVASVQCTVSSGDLPLTITWAFNGDPVILSDIVSITKSGHRISTLVIESVSARLVGNYTCIARNDAGIASHTSELRVNGLCALTETYFHCMLGCMLAVLFTYSSISLWGLNSFVFNLQTVLFDVSSLLAGDNRTIHTAVQ